MNLRLSTLLRGVMAMRGRPSLTGTTTCRAMVNFHHPSVSLGDRPPDPSQLAAGIEPHVQTLTDWWQNKQKVLALTGAGVSTESGVPDYRGYNGSYYSGHKPMIHQEFMKSSKNRQRYWGRGMVGWKYFDLRQPNAGHYALAKLEEVKKLGVRVEDKMEFCETEEDFYSSSGQRELSVVTQNVDSLHRRAGTKHLVELHGRTDQLNCMTCGTTRHRRDFHQELEERNREFFEEVTADSNTTMRADGDAEVNQSYDTIQVPNCQNCGDGFFKPDVVFFGDTVPRHRVRLVEAAVEACDGLLVVGSSLTVHSAFRHVRAAHAAGIPIAILNVGETRAETEGLDVLKIEAPAGPTLQAFAAQL